ncbi:MULTISPECIES: cell division/cell wall cluster transcriptional repressor MraZ [unclassified Mycoplasma]|uniref:cell division/cell wall cluster transcriptional repressor MraZ n=1 Tax=unclassified Mycoplasma TaxID=2683645 RepID=UPI00281263F6|nr:MULTISPECIES: cell division/cell wall cluster transcriptional repressor MraZ [unclassified Mycoplasma]
MLGQQLRNIDSKNRVVLPPVFKEKLGDEFILTIGFDGNAELRTKEAFNEYLKLFENKSFFDKSVRNLTRLIMGNAFEIKLDSMSRISLPKKIIEKLTIQKEVIFVGVGSMVELWSKEMFEEFENQYNPDDLSKLAQEISTLNER